MKKAKEELIKELLTKLPRMLCRSEADGNYVIVVGKNQKAKAFDYASELFYGDKIFDIKNLKISDLGQLLDDSYSTDNKKEIEDYIKDCDLDISGIEV